MKHLRMDRMKRTMFTKFATPKYDRYKKWYGVIDFENSKPSQLMEYESRFRSEAVNIFQNKAKQLGGKLSQVGVL